jgi:hypothetical protein
MFKRLFQRTQMPERLAILLTNPRSGSTWLFDAMRCHPSVVIRPQADVFEYFGMTGRRYPRDLAGDANHAVRIEVRPGEWDMLPGFALPEQRSGNMLPEFSLEKCHPHFFKHDVDGFVHKLEALAPRTTVRMIYQMRDPQESLLSFLQYKQRNPTWNPHIGPEELPAHMRRIYESLLRCGQKYPGLIVDYTELEADFRGTLARIFGFLWDASTDGALLDAIEDATRRENRKATTFLGQRTTDVHRDKASYSAMFERHAEDIAACEKAYQELLRLR